MDLFCDDLTFAIEFFFVKGSIIEEVSEDFECGEGFVVGDFGVIASVVFVGEGIDDAALAFDGVGDGFCATFLGAFEEHVFDEVASAIDGLGLVATADADVDGDLDAFGLGFFEGGDFDAVGEGGNVEGVKHGWAFWGVEISGHRGAGGN